MIDIQECVNRLEGNLSYYINRMKFTPPEKRSNKILIVEGSTDHDFVSKILKAGVECKTAASAFKPREMADDVIYNSKETICETVRALSEKKGIVDRPFSLDGINIYGMIDKDFDNSRSYQNDEYLFVTDTHDLETLLLSTDEKLFDTISKCSINADEVKKAYFIAYQVNVIQIFVHRAIKDVRSNGSRGKRKSRCRSLPSLSNDADFGQFINQDCQINVQKFVRYINNNADEKLSTSEINKIINSLLADKRFKKKLGKEGVWKGTLDKFDTDNIPDFWDVVKGHDILAVIRYLNSDAAEAYDNKGEYSLNRDFENDLIANYNYPALKNTQMYQKMYSDDIVREV